MCSRLPLVAWLLFLVVPIDGLAQQRIIVNPTFVKRFQRDGTTMPDYNAAVSHSFCSQAGSCLRYLGDARCLTPTNAPVDTQGCMAGWITTDPFDGFFASTVQDGNIKAPTQVGIGPNLEGLSVPNGSAELNAQDPGRLYQIVCLAGGEVIPFSYSLGDPNSTAANNSQARFGVFVNNSTYPGTPAGPSAVVSSSVVSTQTMVPQTGTVTAPVAGGLYQIGFEAIQPASGTQGNYISDVSITLKPLIDFSAPTLQIIEGQNGFLLVRVNGTVPAGGVSVSLQPGAATASPSEYTLGTPVAFGSAVVGSASLSSNGAGGYLLFIPQGAYDGNALSDARNETATTPSGSVRIPVSTTADSSIEDNETFSLTVEAPGTHGSSPQAQWDLATAASCSTSPSETATVTIVDNDVDLMATKLVDNPAPAAGSSVTYTVAFTNTTAAPTVAPVTAHDANAAVADAVQSGLTFTAWTCTASGGASCPGGVVNGTTSGSGAISGTAFLPAGGGSVTLTITAIVGATQCGSVTNTATVSVPAGLEEAVAGNNSASAVIAPICPAALAVSVTDGSAIYTPGSTGTYTITVTNSGLAAAANLNVADSLPSGVTLTGAPGCTPAGTATCGAISGSAGGTSFTATGGSLATGAGNSLTFTLPVAFAPSMAADPLVNTASATASNAPTPVSGSDSDTRSPFTVGISKSTTSTVAQPGSTVSYTVTATNSGAVAVPSATLADPIPAGLTSFSWTCTAAGGAGCPHASGSGAINETLTVFPAGGSVQYLISATVSAAPPATVTNTATITPPGGGACSGGSAPPCSSSAALPAGAVVSVHKSTTTTSVTPNGPVSFTVTVTNSGSVPAPNTNLSDPQPAGIASQSWTCAPSGGAVCPAASGTGALSETIATFPAGGALTYTIAAVATAAPPAAVTNTATITPPAGGTCEDGCSATAAASAAPVIDAQAMSTSINGVAGQNVTMTFKVTNAGAAAADGTHIDDPIPAGLSSFAWTCSATGGAVCPNASGTGSIAETIGTFPSGGSLTYVVTALVSTSPPPAITNTATITPPAGGLCTGSCIVTMQIRIAITSIPTLGTIGLLLLAAGLAVAATLLLRRR